ncbi:MAG: nucleotidyltransferase family protein [Acidimicrobiia bacterium]|nr:nucleotidyltransferase family protein [Acidimicrobiia bacterium]
MRTAALVLAAGSSSRLGRPKQLIDWGGKPLLDVVLDQVRTWPVDEIWVVLGACADDILEGCDFEGTSVVINDDYQEGLASSLRVGLDGLMRSSKVEGALVVMGDQPTIDPEVVSELLRRFGRSAAKAVVPKYRYTWSNPVVVARSLWPRLMSLEGDSGAQKLLKAHPEWVEEVWLETLPPRDIDTEEDIADLSPRSPV